MWMLKWSVCRCLSPSNKKWKSQIQTQKTRINKWNWKHNRIWNFRNGIKSLAAPVIERRDSSSANQRFQARAMVSPACRIHFFIELRKEKELWEKNHRKLRSPHFEVGSHATQLENGWMHFNSASDDSRGGGLAATIIHIHLLNHFFSLLFLCSTKIGFNALGAATVYCSFIRSCWIACCRLCVRLWLVTIISIRVLDT